MKYINFKRYKFSTATKNINIFIYNFLKLFKFLDLKRYDFRKIYKYLDIRRFGFKKITKYFNPETYSFNLTKIKKINFFNSKFFILHIPGAIIFFAFLYFFIPTFYNYDKSNIENVICKNNKFECVIRGEINYSFFPTPGLKINDLIINRTFDKKSTLLTVENVSIKLSIKNLLAKEKHKFKKIEFKNFEGNLNLKNLKKYNNILKKKINFIPVTFIKGKILFYENNNYVASIKDANLNMKFSTDSTKTKLKGKFLDDNIVINFDRENIDNKESTDITLKMLDLNLFTNFKFSDTKEDKNIKSGNFLIKKDKNKITGIFDYKDGQFIINKSNLRNTFIDGKLVGKITFLPYFNFNLDVNLNSVNFTKLYSYFLSLDEESQKNLFRVNKRINGKLNLSSDKIYSSYNLVKSLESRIKFNNGNILIEQFLINLGKLGAADVLGSIENEKKFSNFNFESNIFVDNQKKFLSKFGIYNTKSIPPNFFISGNFDLQNAKASFYEIFDNEKLSNEDVNFIEKEFNDFMLADGYENLFQFPILKKFVKSITTITD